MGIASCMVFRPSPSQLVMRRGPRKFPVDRKTVTEVLPHQSGTLAGDREAEVYPKRVYLELEPGRTGAEQELWSLRKEAGYFREAFGRELFATLA